MKKYAVMLLALAVLVISACGTTPASNTPSPTVTVTVAASPEAVQFTPEEQQVIDSIVMDLPKANKSLEVLTQGCDAVNEGHLASVGAYATRAIGMLGPLSESFVAAHPAGGLVGGAVTQLENDYSKYLNKQLDTASGLIKAIEGNSSAVQAPWRTCLALQTKLDADLAKIGQ